MKKLNLNDWNFRNFGIPITKETKNLIYIDTGYDWVENGTTRKLQIKFDKRSLKNCSIKFPLEQFLQLFYQKGIKEVFDKLVKDTEHKNNLKKRVRFY